jgi:hypothetical protein
VQTRKRKVHCIRWLDGACRIVLAAGPAESGTICPARRLSLRSSAVLAQAKVLSLLILANFLAQVPYFFHLYYGRQSAAISLRSFLIMAAVFGFFATAAILLFTRRRFGYPLMLIFLSAEFLFYLLGLVESTIRGYGLFFQVHNPDIMLRIIYSIGYMNLFAAGYFIILLLTHRDTFASS